MSGDLQYERLCELKERVDDAEHAVTCSENAEADLYWELQDQKDGVWLSKEEGLAIIHLMTEYVAKDIKLTVRDADSYGRILLELLEQLEE